MTEWHSMSCHFFPSPGHIFISFFPCQNPKDCFTVLYNLSVRSLTHKTHVIIPLWGLALSFSRVFQCIKPCTRKPGRQQRCRRISQRGGNAAGHQGNSKLQWDVLFLQAVFLHLPLWMWIGPAMEQAICSSHIYECTTKQLECAVPWTCHLGAKARWTV